MNPGQLIYLVSVFDLYYKWYGSIRIFMKMSVEIYTIICHVQKNNRKLYFNVEVWNISGVNGNWSTALLTICCIMRCVMWMAVSPGRSVFQVILKYCDLRTITVM